MNPILFFCLIVLAWLGWAILHELKKLNNAIGGLRWQLEQIDERQQRIEGREK